MIPQHRILPGGIIETDDLDEAIEISRRIRQSLATGQFVGSSPQDQYRQCAGSKVNGDRCGQYVKTDGSGGCRWHPQEVSDE